MADCPFSHEPNAQCTHEECVMYPNWCRYADVPKCGGECCDNKAHAGCKCGSK